MNHKVLSRFFLWCTLINGGLFLLISVVILLVPDFVYRVQTFFLPISKDAFQTAIYALLGLYKIFWLMFNITPWIALSIINSRAVK